MRKHNTVAPKSSCSHQIVRSEKKVRKKSKASKEGERENQAPAPPVLQPKS